MTSIAREAPQKPARAPAPAKWAFWIGVVALAVASAWLDDRFLADAHDAEWRKFATWSYLLPHAICGATAFLIGLLQFSDRLRARRPDLHRWLGRVYVGASLFAGPTAAVIAVDHHHPLSVALLQVFQGGLWTLATAMALYLAMKRRFAAHKLWMMRSYGFCLVFLSGRLPDIDPHFDGPARPASAFSSPPSSQP